LCVLKRAVSLKELNLLKRGELFLERDACLLVREVWLLLVATTEAATRAQERAGVERRAAAPLINIQ
jgi:hypothetical protein